MDHAGHALIFGAHVGLETGLADILEPVVLPPLGKDEITGGRGGGNGLGSIRFVVASQTGCCERSRPYPEAPETRCWLWWRTRATAGGFEEPASADPSVRR